MNNKQIALFGNFFSWRGYYKSPCETLADYLEGEGYLIIRTSKIITKPLRILDMLYTIVANKNYIGIGIIDVFSGSSFIWAEMVAYSLRVLKKPYILKLHGGNLPEFAKKNPRRVNILFRNAYRLVSPSLFIYYEFKSIRPDICFIPSPFRINEYFFQHRKNVKADLLWLRAFHEIYNPQLAIKVVKKLVEMNVDVHLSMIGPDKGDGSLSRTKATAKRIGVIDRVDFVGPIPKTSVPDWLTKGDVFINTTNIDNVPVSLLEAMATGLCVISTNVGGIPYLIDHMKDGILVPPSNENAMANAIKEIIESPSLASKLSKQAQKKAEQYEISLSMKKWKSLLEDCVPDQWN